MDARHDSGHLGVAIGVGDQLRDRSIGRARAQLAAGDEAVGQREHLRRAAVVLAQAHDARAGVSVREGGQVLGAGAGEAVDRLVGVADDAQVAPIAQPQPQQVLLEPVRVLVLVDAEPAVAPMRQRQRVGIGLVQLDREGEHVLEVDPVGPRLGLLVSAPEGAEDVGRHGRLALRAVGLRAHAADLGPLDLIGQVLRRRELVAARQASRQWTDDPQLRVEHLGQVRAMDERPEVGELAARGGMEGRGLHLRQPERLQPMAHLGRGLLGEGHDQRLLRVDRLGGRRVRHAVADDPGLARAGAGEDDDRAGRGHAPPRAARRSGRPGWPRDPSVDGSSAALTAGRRSVQLRPMRPSWPRPPDRPARRGW